MGEPAIRFIEPPEPNPRFLAVEITGRFTAGDMRDFLRQLDEATAGGEKVLLYEDHRPGDSPADPPLHHRGEGPGLLLADGRLGAVGVALSRC